MERGQRVPVWADVHRVWQIEVRGKERRFDCGLVGSNILGVFWDEAVETLERRELERLQVERINRLIERLIANVPYYREQLSGAGSVRSLGELAALPFTTKQTLREHYPFGLLGVPLDAIVRIHTSSGTTGKPTVVAYTESDMVLWSQLMARVLTAGGVTRDDIAHNALGYGLFTGGLGFALGSETVGAATVPAATGHTKRHLMLMEDFGATALYSTPSYALVLAEAVAEQRIELERLALRVGFFGAEPWTDAMRSAIESGLGLEAYDNYGLSEIIGPGVAAECPEHYGLHIFEDHFVAEVVDPETGQRLADGDEGELVLTTLTKQGLALLRYRTRDRVRLDRGTCACGRTLARMSKVLGRTDDMLIVRGVNVFPSQIEHALLSFDELLPQYQIVVERRDKALDELEVCVEASSESVDRGSLESRVRARVEETLGIRVRVRVVSPKHIERSQGKAVRIVDRRAAGGVG